MFLFICVSEKNCVYTALIEFFNFLKINTLQEMLRTMQQACQAMSWCCWLFLVMKLHTHGNEENMDMCVQTTNLDCCSWDFQIPKTQENMDWELWQSGGFHCWYSLSTPASAEELYSSGSQVKRTGDHFCAPVSSLWVCFHCQNKMNPLQRTEVRTKQGNVNPPLL